MALGWLVDRGCWSQRFGQPGWRRLGFSGLALNQQCHSWGGSPHACPGTKVRASCRGRSLPCWAMCCALCTGRAWRILEVLSLPCVWKCRCLLADSLCVCCAGMGCKRNLVSVHCDFRYPIDSGDMVAAITRPAHQARGLFSKGSLNKSGFVSSLYANCRLGFHIFAWERDAFEDEVWKVCKTEPVCLQMLWIKF